MTDLFRMNTFSSLLVKLIDDVTSRGATIKLLLRRTLQREELRGTSKKFVIEASTTNYKLQTTNF
ncbi:MAG: hypothetical protein ICV53_18500 [Flavisolibacter sp.]|nr:hypothetical protein [Flavisolibacter sp.]